MDELDDADLRDLDRLSDDSDSFGADRDGQQAQDEIDINLETFECPLRDWIAEDRTRREIRKRFRLFLKTFYVGIEEVRLKTRT